MPYYNHNRNTRRVRPNSSLPGQPNFSYRGTGTRRHEWASSIANTSSLAVGDYFLSQHVRFVRTFGSGSPPAADVEPTPTVGNNFQTPSVMNGSKIVNFRKRIKIKNNQTTTVSTSTQKTVTLQVYEMAFSFWDAYLFDQWGTNAGLPDDIVDFLSSTNEEGEVPVNNTHPTLTINLIKNSRFLQRYLRHVGQIVMAPGEEVELLLNRVPPKCRRSNFGMFWAHLFLNDSTLNAGEAIAITANEETSFEEIPSDERQGWLY